MNQHAHISQWLHDSRQMLAGVKGRSRFSPLTPSALLALANLPLAVRPKCVPGKARSNLARQHQVVHFYFGDFGTLFNR